MLGLVLGLAAAGCGTTTTTTYGPIPKEIADDIKARGLDREPPKPAPPPAASEFKPYTSPDGLFRINFPGDPRAADLGPSKPMNRSGMQAYTLVLKPRQYSVLVSNYEEDREPAKELQYLIDLQVSQTLEGKLVESKDVTIKEKPGKEIVIVDDDRARRGKLIVAGKNVYQVTVDLPATEINGEAAKAFIDSFELLKD